MALEYFFLHSAPPQRNKRRVRVVGCQAFFLLVWLLLLFIVFCVFRLSERGEETEREHMNLERIFHLHLPSHIATYLCDIRLVTFPSHLW